MGIERVRKYGKRSAIVGHRYTRFQFNYESDKDYFTKGFNTILQFLADRKKSAIVAGLQAQGAGKTAFIRQTQKPLFGCQAVAKTLGYRSPSSGYKHRLTYFKFAPQAFYLIPYLNMHGCLFYRYPCSRLILT
jgi:hypothetical protein